MLEELENFTLQGLLGTSNEIQEADSIEVMYGNKAQNYDSFCETPTDFTTLTLPLNQAVKPFSEGGNTLTYDGKGIAINCVSEGNWICASQPYVSVHVTPYVSLPLSQTPTTTYSESGHMPIDGENWCYVEMIKSAPNNPSSDHTWEIVGGSLVGVVVLAGLVLYARAQKLCCFAGNQGGDYRPI